MTSSLSNIASSLADLEGLTQTLSGKLGYPTPDADAHGVSNILDFAAALSQRAADLVKVLGPLVDAL